MLFFAIIERLGLRQTTLATRMGISDELLTNVKHGRRRPTQHFRAQAVAVLAAMRIRRGDGAAYTEAELFDVVVSTEESESDTTVLVGAGHD